MQKEVGGWIPRVDAQMHGWVDVQACRWMDAWVDRWMDIRVGVRADGCRVAGRVGAWMTGGGCGWERGSVHEWADVLVGSWTYGSISWCTHGWVICGRTSARVGAQVGA